MHEDERLSNALRLVPVPEHGPDFQARREAALAAAGPLAAGQGRPWTSSRKHQRRPTSKRLLIIAAAASIALAAAVLAAVLLTAGSGGERQTLVPPSHSRAAAGGITSGPAPEQVGDELSGMVGGLDGEPWTWGYRHRKGGPGSPLLERWDGQRWQAVRTPSGKMAAVREIDGVAAPSGRDLWVAYDTPRGGRLAHWDGVRWKAFPAIDFVSTSETSNALLAVSPNDVWAVGWAGTRRQPPNSRLTTMHWNGNRWSSIPTPAFGRGVGDVSLRLVRGVSPDAVWALGDYQRYRRKTVGRKVQWVPVRWEQFLLLWDGRRWTRQPWPTSQLSSGLKDRIAINDLVVASDAELWCAGSRWFGPDNSSDLWVPIVLRFLAGRWQVMASSAAPSLPADWKQFMSTSIALTSSQDVWVAGGTDTSSSLWHWDGGAWSVVDLPEAQSPTQSSARSVLAVAANDVWVLCQGSTTSDRLEQLEPFFLHFDGTAWQRVPAAPHAGAQR